MRFLLDTNALSEPLKPRPDASFMEQLREHAGECAISSVTVHEVQFGVYRLPAGSRRRMEVEDYLARVVGPALPVLPYDAQAAVWHAAERARLAAAGLTPSFADGQIAAIAATRGLAVVTANVRHFNVFDGVTVVDWRAAPAR